MTKSTKLLISVVFVMALQAESIANTDQVSGSDIRIFTGKHHSIEEYRAHGKLYMIKVKPHKGPPYYLIDADGDGDLETRKNDLSPNLLIPSWVLFSW